MSRLLIADASNLIFRGGSIKRKDPEYPGGWSYLLRTVFKHISSFNPTHLIIAGDGMNGSEFRKQIFSEYKANRPPCPTPIKYQLMNAHSLCEKLNLPFVTHPRYEADDVIYSFVQQAIKYDFNQIRIIADDKDLYVCLDDQKVEIHRLTRSEILNVETNGVIKHSNFGIKPKQIPDFLSLVGDKVDNIPGCCSIGTQRAQYLLNKYEDIDDIFEHLDELQIANKTMANKLRVHKEIIYKSLSMTRLVDLSNEMNVNLHDTRFDICSCINGQTDKVLSEFGLEGLYKELMLDTKEEVSRNFNEMKELIAI